MSTASIIGTGLVGGSIAAGLTASGWDVVGYDADPDSLMICMERGLITSTVASVRELLDESDGIIVVAAPPKATIEILANLETDRVVMDVSGVKTGPAVAAEHLLNFVGTHPMAGRESSGPGAASPALFRGANWVVGEGSPVEATSRTVDLVKELGANPVFMSAEAHDRAVASISHLPQVLAGGLLSATMNTPNALDLAAGSFRDLTRVAASEPMPWVEILRANDQAVFSAIDALRSELDKLEEAIGSDDDALLTLLSNARDTRRSLGAPVASVRILLADTPGEIARVGHALEESHVDVRDIQMRHSPYGGGGVLTIAVRAGDEEALRHALADVGLESVP